MWLNIERIRFWRKIHKEFQIMKGALKADNPITSNLDRYKIWANPFCKKNIGARNKNPRRYV